MTPVIDPIPSTRNVPSAPPSRGTTIHATARLLRTITFKRVCDLPASLLLFVTFGPIFFVIALWVRLDSLGPVIFRQTRVGRGGRSFTLYKFRTMHASAPILPTDQMEKQSVSYYTRSGRILRRLSLDELPQLWNVFRGEMALVGPRPALPTQEWLNQARDARGVHDLRPGITGWAQVCGRDELLDSDKLECDAYYRDHVSFALDAWILWRTIMAVATGRGAK